MGSHSVEVQKEKVTSEFQIIPYIRFISHADPGGGGGYSQKNWVGVCGPLPKTLTLFMTKTYEIPYPIYDLTLKSKPSSDQTVNKKGL